MPRALYQQRHCAWKSNGHGTVYEHHIIAERALGRPLPRGAQVHHFDENKRNNANANLVICQDNAYHKLLHVRQRVKAAGGNPNTDRICSACESVLPKTQFNRATRVKSEGLQRICRPCQREYQRTYVRPSLRRAS